VRKLLAWIRTPKADSQPPTIVRAVPLEIPSSRRLDAALALALQLAGERGHSLVGTDDLREAIARAPQPQRRLKAPTWEALDEDTHELLEAAADEAARLRHPELAPEHLLLNGASPADRSRLIGRLAAASTHGRWWRIGRRLSPRANPRS
jgi:nucleotide-binding universal stress UspA family protein